MLQGETLIDTMQQLAWEALEEGKSVLAEVEKVGDRMTRADVLFNTVEMQMLGLRGTQFAWPTGTAVQILTLLFARGLLRAGDNRRREESL
jgi:hypothetical protein